MALTVVRLWLGKMYRAYEMKVRLGHARMRLGEVK